MPDKIRPTEPETVSCKVCLKEVPVSAAKSEESDEYVLHFCGLECYDKWRHKKESPEDIETQEWGTYNYLGIFWAVSAIKRAGATQQTPVVNSLNHDWVSL